MSWLESEKKRHNNLGGTMSGGFEKHTSDYIKQTIKESPNYREVEINGEKFHTRFLTEKKFSVASGYDVMKLLYEPWVKPRNGQLICIDEEIWLSVYANHKELSPFNFIRKCTHTLSFPTKKNTVSEQPCVLETRIRDTQKTLDLTYVNLSLDSLKATVQYNEVTKHIKENMRFVIEGLAWEVQGFDRITHVENGDGIIEIAMKKVPLSNEEREKENNKIKEETVVKIKIEGSDRVLLGEAIQLNATVSFDGEKVLDGVVEWEDDRDLINEFGFIETDCDMETGKLVVRASYKYLDHCNEIQEVEDFKTIDIYKKGSWW